MNYQPFFGVNLLVSDQLLLELQQQKLAIALLILMTLFVFYFLAYAIHQVLRSYFFRPVSVSNGNAKDLIQ